MIIIRVLIFLIFLVLLGIFLGIVLKFNNLLKEISLIKKTRIIFISVFVLLMIIGFIISFMDTIVIYMHLILFWLLIDLIIFIIKKFIKLKIKKYISFICAIIITVVYLAYAYNQAINVARTSYELHTEKNIGNNDFRIVQISDSHIGNTINGDEFIEYMEKINKENPDIVVVTGDFIDDDTSYSDMVKGCVGLGKLNTKYGVYFIYGNHDASYFNYRDYSKDDFENQLEKNSVIILDDKVANINDNIVLVGRMDKRFEDRLNIFELTKNIDMDKYIIVLDHQPNDYKNEAESKVDLVLSGHTHGGQLFPLGFFGELFNINDNTYGLKKVENTNFIVNSGLSDWAIKFKSFTKSEYVVIDIKN